MSKPRLHRRKTENDVIKICSKCGDEKPHRWICDKRKRNGGCPAAMCRECRAKMDKIRHKNPIQKQPVVIQCCKSCGDNNPHSWLADSRRETGGYYRHICVECHKLVMKTNWRTLKRMAIDFLGGECIKCGIRDDCYAIYDFHHKDINKKDFNIGDLFKGKYPRQFEEIKTELEKCELLCSNCHRRLHQEERDGRYFDSLE